MGVVLSEAGARKLRDVVRKVDAMKQDRTGTTVPAGAVEDSMWGYITGSSPNGLIYSFVRVIPTVADDADFLIDGGVMRFSIADTDPPHLYAAAEANGARGVAVGRVVRLNFVGFRENQGETVPMFIFQYEQPNPFGGGLPVHDHRDNLQGGFSFSCYHPGTALPQQNWHGS